MIIGSATPNDAGFSSLFASKDEAISDPVDDEGEIDLSPCLFRSFRPRVSRVPPIKTLLDPDEPPDSTELRLLLFPLPLKLLRRLELLLLFCCCLTTDESLAPPISSNDDTVDTEREERDDLFCDTLLFFLLPLPLGDGRASASSDTVRRGSCPELPALPAESLLTSRCLNLPVPPDVVAALLNPTASSSRARGESGRSPLFCENELEEEFNGGKWFVLILASAVSAAFLSASALNAFILNVFVDTRAHISPKKHLKMSNEAKVPTKRAAKRALANDRDSFEQ